MIYSCQIFFEVRTIKEDVECLEEIIADIPSDFSAKEKARMAYIELGKNSFYNTKYKHLYGEPQLEIFNETKKPYLYIINKYDLIC